jgi:protein-S-isoprenylcysteine O-methyltransferase Ste14
MRSPEESRMTSPYDDHPHVIAPPPLIVLIFIAAGTAAGLIYPLRFIEGNARYLTGAALVVLSVIITSAAFFRMKRAGTNVDVRKPVTMIVTGGIYSRTRNPMYVSLVIFLAAVAILLNNLWIMILIPLFIAVMRRGVIEREERYLEEKFGAQYSEYKSRVRRWL